MAAMAAVDGTTGAAAALLEEACSEEEAAMESEDSSSEGSGAEDLPETAAATAAASATQQEYAELVAGLLRNPEAHFAASSFDLLHALREEQQQLSRQQQELGAQRLKTQWLPLIQQLQQLQQQEQQMRRPPQQQPQAQQQKKSDRALVLRCLQALQEDGAAWERQAKTEALGRRSSSSSEDSELTTAGLLQQLDRGQLFHRSGRLFTAVDADTEVWTSSDDEEQQRQQHRSGSSNNSSQCLGDDGIGGVDDEKLRFPAAVLPLRAALRGVRRQQRDQLQVRQLLLQWAQPDSRLGQLQHVAAVWDEDGLFSAARAAAQQGQQQQQPPTEQQQQRQQQQRKKGQQPQEEDGGVIERGNDVAHALAELQQVEQLEVAKRGRRELRAWKAAARELFGWDMYGGLEQLLQSAAVAAAQTSAGPGGAVAAARALLPDEEQQQLLRLLRRRWMSAEEPQEVAGGEGEGQQQQEENKKKIFLSAKEREESSTKKRQGGDREQGDRPLPQVQELSISPPPACFFSHGLEELRCVSCRVWLTQTQQLLQLQQEGACSFLLQPVQTHLVKQLLLLQQEQRLQRVLGGRQVATAGAAAAAAAARLQAAAAAPAEVRGRGPAVARISAASAGGEGAAAAVATGAEGGEEGERWETDEGYKIIAAPDVGVSPHAEKLYVGHLGLLYTTVWGGGYSCGPHTSELLLWLRLLQPFHPLQLRRDGPPRSRERHAQRWQLLRDAYYRSGVSQSQQQQKQQPLYILPFEDLHQQQQPKKTKNATAPAYKNLYSRALQKKDKIVVETDVDSSETEGEARERRRLAAVRQKQQQLTVPQRQQRSKGAAVAAASSTSSPSLARAHASFSAAAEDVELEMAEEAEGCVTTPPGKTTAATGSGQQEAAYQGRILGEEDNASDEEEIDVSRYLRYLGKGFVHVNRAWMHKPFRRRRLPLPLPGRRASDAAAAAVGKGDRGSGSSRSQGGVKTARGSSSAAQEEAAASWRSGEHVVLSQQHRFREKATAEAEDQHQQQPHPAENGDFTWTVELSSSEDSVRAYQGGAARYRRRYRVWRRRQRDLRARRLQQQQQQETSDNPISRCSSPRGATSAAGVETVSGAAALAAAGDPGAVDESRQGHALEDFLRRLGGMSYSRYSQLAATAAAGAAAAAAAARKQLLGGRLKRRRGEGRSSSSRSAGPSAEQRAAALQLQQLRPRRVWGWYWAAETGDEEEEEEEGRGLGFMHMLNFRRKLYRMRRKPRTRAVEPSWDPQLHRRTRGKQGSIQQPQQQRRWQLQQPWQQQRSVDEAAAETEQSSPRVFPFGVAATGWWGPSGGDTAEVRGKQGPPAGKGREVQFICVDDRELHTRMGKTRLYQERFEGLEDELTNRREYYAVVDEENRRIYVVPAGRLSFFLTETPRQIENDFMEQMFGDLRRNARGSFLQTLLLKRRSARNVLLMNAMLWQSQLKHLNQIRLCRLLGGFWRDAAFASGDAPLTEQQLLEDFLSVNTHALHVLEAAAAEGAGAGSTGGGNATAPQQEASTRWTDAAVALEDRWRQERTSAAAEETEEHGGINSAETPLVDAAAARLRVPRAALRVIDQAATDASAVAALAAAAADRRSQRETCRRLLPRLLLRYIHRVFPAFVHVYLTSRCAFAVQKAEEQNFTRRVRQVENVGLAGVGNVGSFTGEVLRGQLERTFGQRTALRPTNRTKEEEAGLDRLKEVLPPFNNKATTPAELFKLDDLVPLGLLEDVEMEGFSGDPFLPFIKGGKSAEIVNAAALEEQWGRFTVDLARHIGQERRNISATKTDGAVVDSILRTLSTEALARLVKVTKALAALFRKQRKSFSGERAVTRFFEDLIKSRAGGNTSAPGKGNIGASQTLPRSGIRWVTKTFLQEDGRGRYFLSPEKQTKLLATLLWVCAALSVRRTFDFEALLSHEWRGRFNLNFEACAALVGLRRLRSKARPREYSLELPPALMQAGTHSTSRLTPVLPLVTREKGRRTVR